MTATGTESDRAFEQEAQLLASVCATTRLPAVIDYFIEAEGRCLVMQYIDGEDLAPRAKRAGGCWTRGGAHLGGRPCSTCWPTCIEHQPPVVHRDIKPAT